MNDDLPLYEPDADATYHLEIVAQLTGISSETILHYQESGLIQSHGDSGKFDDDALLTLSRIEHLRSTCEANLAGIRLILDLMKTVEELQTELRMRH
ncbi:MAG: chaperone modulator CbpM [Luteolibacter sp.]